jgi:hypothetical protein
MGFPHSPKGMNRLGKAEIPARGSGRGEWICTIDLLVPNHETQKSKCFIWCRLGAKKPFFLSLSCTEWQNRSQSQCVSSAGLCSPIAASQACRADVSRCYIDTDD